MKRILIPAVLTAALVAGCAGPTAVRGGPGTENPNLDEAAMSTGLDRKDLEYLMQQNMEKLKMRVEQIREDGVENIDDELADEAQYSLMDEAEATTEREMNEMLEQLPTVIDRHGTVPAAEANGNNQ